MRSVSLLIVLGLMVGCNPLANRKLPSPKSEEGEEIATNPLKGLDQLTKMAQKMEAIQKEIAEMKPVAPVHFDKLIPLLPKAPAGYEAEKPRGETTDAGEFKFTIAQQTYRSGEKSLEVKLHDAAHIPQFYAWLSIAAMTKRETTEGHEKGLTIDGNPAFERYTKEGKHLDLTVLIAKRHLIEIRVHGEDPEFARTVLQSIDQKTLAGLK